MPPSSRTGRPPSVVMRAERAEALGVEPLAEILAHGMCADRFAYLHTVPAMALEKALKKAGRDLHDLGLLEVNEAFASVALHATRMLGADQDMVNVNGGSVALGTRPRLHRRPDDRDARARDAPAPGRARRRDLVRRRRPGRRPALALCAELGPKAAQQLRIFLGWCESSHQCPERGPPWPS